MSQYAITGEPPVLLDVRAVAKMLNCSTRHVCRMAGADQMPSPVRLGTLCRWSRPAINDWISGGCKPVRASSAQAPQSPAFQQLHFDFHKE